MSDYVIAQNMGEPKDENGQPLGRDLLEPLLALPAGWTDLRLHQAPDGTISITELIPHDFVGGTFSNTHPPRVSWVDVPMPPTLPPPHACSNCGATVAECDEHIQKYTRGCCGLCVMMDTHGLIPKGA